MPDVLQRIYAAKAQQLTREMEREPYETVRARALARVKERRPFLRTLEAVDAVAIVAEIKRASPSAGLIARNFDPVAIGRTYESAGADAISILTEEDHFLGDLRFLDEVRAVTTRPILRKDFLSTPYQVAQSAAYGADCLLVIVAGLNDTALQACMLEAREYALDVLVEVHDEGDLARAVKLDAGLIGVNNRNLRTMTTDLAVSEYLLPMISRNVYAISESGMSDAADIRRLSAAGARACLVGESLMRAENPADQVAALKRACARV